MAGWRGNLAGSLAILAVIAAISLGLPLVDRVLPDHRALPAGIRISVGNGVTVLAPTGAYIDTAETSPRLGRLVLEVHGVRYAMRAIPYRGTLQEAADRLRNRIGEEPGYQLSGPVRRVTTRDGVPGLAGRFASARRGGYFAVFVASGRVVEVVAQGVGIALGRTLTAVRASVATIRFEAAP